MDFIKIKGVIKDYDWGTQDYIASLLKIDESGRKAEYWMGTHPKGEAVAEDGRRLSSVIGHRLSFLFKVLSIASPLSLQCHPDKAQAEEGWKREKEKRQKGGECNYMDDNEKAEIIASITPITALCGFKAFPDIKKKLKERLPLSYDRFFSQYNNIEELFLACFSFDEETKRKILSELERMVLSSLSSSFDGEYLTEDGIIRETLEKYPGDIGSIFPLMMNIVALAPGDALYLEPDTLHAYLRGNGVELMTASDNVLRGGLTSKRVDIKELERIMYFGLTEARKTETETENGVVWYITPNRDFRLGKVKDKGSFFIEKESIFLSFGNTELKTKDNSWILKRGECAYASRGERISIKTDDALYIATGGIK